MKHIAPSAATATALPAELMQPAPMSRKELFNGIAKMFYDKGGVFYEKVTGIESMPADKMKQISTHGTALQDVVDFLSDKGIVVEHNVGAARSYLDLEEDAFHKLMCSCESPQIGSATAGSIFERLTITL